MTWLTAPECLHRDGITYDAESTSVSASWPSSLEQVARFLHKHQDHEACLALAHKTKELDTRAALLAFAYEFRTVAKRLQRDERKFSDGVQK